MPVSSRENIRNVLANPTSSEDVALKPMWLNLIKLDPANLDDIESAKAKVVLYGESGSDKTENMLNHLKDAYESLDVGRQSSVDFYFVDKAENPSVAAIHGINQFPALLFFIFGMQLKKVTGEISSAQLQDYLEDFFKKSDWSADRINKFIWTGNLLTKFNGNWSILFDDLIWSGFTLVPQNGNWSIEEI